MRLGDGPLRAVIEPATGGRLSSLRAHGTELLVAAGASDDPLRWGCYPMVPWAGRVADGRFQHGGKNHQLPVNAGPHALHGTAFGRPWSVVGPGSLRVALDAPWPFGGAVRSDVTVIDQAVRWTLTVTAGDSSMPVVVGWHPWFRRTIDGRSAELDFSADAMLERDDRHIPTGVRRPVPAGPWDDCFEGVRQPIVITWPGIGGLELRSDCSHWVIFTEPSDSLCVEPQSAPPDAFNGGGAVELHPGQTLERWFELRWVP